jgi:membrane protein required for colicin V production
MAAIILGIAGAVFLSGPISAAIEKNFGFGMWSQIIAFLGCFVVIYIIIKILENVIQKIFDKLNLEKLDKALGFILGLLEAFLVIAVLVFLLSWFTWIPNLKELLQESFIARFISPFLVTITQNQVSLFMVFPYV